MSNRFLKCSKCKNSNSFAPTIGVTMPMKTASEQHGYHELDKEKYTIAVSCKECSSKQYIEVTFTNGMVIVTER